MSYETAVARMYALGHELTHMSSHKFDLEHMRVLLGALNHPEQRFPSVLIAGTNGKGSTAATLGSRIGKARRPPATAQRPPRHWLGPEKRPPWPWFTETTNAGTAEAEDQEVRHRQTEPCLDGQQLAATHAGAVRGILDFALKYW